MLRVVRLEKKKYAKKLFELSQLLIKRAQMIPECVLKTLQSPPVEHENTEKNVLRVKRVTFF